MPAAQDGRWDAVVVGSGPNGLAAGITLAEFGWRVLIREAATTAGGGARSAELTLPGFVHDVCSAVHPLAVASPFFQTLPLERYGVAWLRSPYAVAHPLDDGTAAALAQDFDTTAATLGVDGEAWHDLMGPLADDGERILKDLLGPFPLPPRHPIAVTRFGLLALLSSTWLARRRFEGEHARALFGGLAAHSMLGLEQPTSAAIGLMLGLIGHMVNWPFPKGGTQQLTDALIAHFKNLGGEIAVDSPVRTLRDLPRARVALFDVTPRQLIGIAGDGLPAWYRHQLSRYRYGPGVVKVDYALDGPVPWTSPECRAAATVHVGGTLAEMVRSESALEHGHFRAQPYVLVTQPSLFDPTRAPQGKHTLWAYCHVPNGYGLDVSDLIEAQIERFAPGFRELILARNVMLPADLHGYNPNYIGGDINGGMQDIRQIFTRPVPRLNPYRTPNPRLYICSSSTPPGGGVHGMCGYHAARTILKRFKQI
jgi:phytoene dehydrogenase-like protein